MKSLVQASTLCERSDEYRTKEGSHNMFLFNHLRGKERRSGKDRRKVDDPNYKGPLRRTGTDRRRNGKDRPSNHQELSEDQKKMTNRIIAFLEKQGK
jgi:hypothetical protein